MNFGTNVKIVAGQASPEDALVTANNYPASGSFVDVEGFQWANIVIHLGAVNNSDTPIFEVKQSDAIDGTLDTIDETYCKKTCAGTDDDQAIVFYIDLDTLDTDHHFLSTVVTGVDNGSYGDIMYYLGGARKSPVSQNSTLLPSDNQFKKV